MQVAISFFSGLIFLAAFAGLITSIVWSLRTASADRAKQRREAVQQFEAWQLTAGANQLHLAPGQCELVQETETVGRNEDGPIYSYTLTRFLRNKDGEYFMFKSTPTGPYVKPVTQVVAKVVLKDRYVPPACS